MAHSTQQTDPWYDTTDAADYVGVKPQTLENWRCTKRQTIEYAKIGRSVRYRKSALDAFIKSRTVSA